MHIEVRLPATASTAFDAWVVPEMMSRWLFVGSSNRIVEVATDERTGGKFYVREEDNGRQIDHYGEYFRFERPTLIEFTLQVPLHFQGVSHVEFLSDQDECMIVLTQTGASPANAEQVWRGLLSGLQRVLLGKPAVAGTGA